MKKRVVLSAIALALTGTLLVGCGSTGLSLRANWYRDNTLTSAISGTDETLTYRVKYSASKNPNPTYSVVYNDGTYTTNLVNTFYEWKDESGNVTAREEVYRLTTSFEISGTYTFGSDKTAFEDSVSSVVYFRTVGNQLQPVYSEKSVHSTSPLTMKPTTASEVCAVYDYATTIQYDKDFTSASVTVKNRKTNTSDTKEVQIGNETFFDNEQLIFLGRAMNVSSQASTRVGTIDTASGMKQHVNYSYLSSGKADYTVNDEAWKDVEETRLALRLDSAFSGDALLLIYANTVSGSNTYRNVLLRMETSLSYQLGSLVYQLESAEFSNK